MHPPQDNNDPNRSQFPPHASPPQLPPETYTYLIHALVSLQNSAYPPQPSPYPSPPSYNYPWPPITAPPFPSAPIAGSSSFYPTNSPIPFPPHVPPQTASSSQLAASPVATPTTAFTAQDPEGNDDTTSIAEDKRRRNTAASARFRTKKKLRTLNLERTVADLSGKSEELEREASDLRRENAWLKEIVVLKGRNLAASNSGSGSQAPAPGNQHDEDAEDDHEAGSAGKRGWKGKDKEI